VGGVPRGVTRSCKARRHTAAIDALCGHLQGLERELRAYEDQRRFDGSPVIFQKIVWGNAHRLLQIPA